MNFLEMPHQKEVSLLEAVHKNPKASQRILSSTLGLSLGQTNTLIQTLIKKGDLDISRTNGREVKYVITKRGYARCVKFTNVKLADAFRCVSDVKMAIGKILDQLFEGGVREFILDGDNDTIAAIVGETFRESIGENAKLVWGPAKAGKDQVILKLDGVDASPSKDVVHLLHELANAG